MAKKPTPSTLKVTALPRFWLTRFKDSVKRNPIKANTAFLLWLAAIGGTYTQWDNITAAFWATADHVLWATPSQARQIARDLITPIVVVQNTQAVAIDRFILFQQQDALSKAKSDPAASLSPIVQDKVKELESQIKDTEARICKGTGKKCGSGGG